jgi:hypothetical protein
MSNDMWTIYVSGHLYGTRVVYLPNTNEEELENGNNTLK